MSNNKNISTPTKEHLFDYLSYQYPACRGDILLKSLCDEIAKLPNLPAQLPPADWVLVVNNRGSLTAEQAAAEYLYQCKKRGIAILP